MCYHVPAMKECRKKLTIGCVTSSISYHGGWDALSKGIIGSVAKEHNVVALTARGEKNDLVSYPIHPVLSSDYISYSFINQIQTFVLTLWYLRKCDIIHVFVEPYAPGAALAARLLRKPLVITIAATYAIPPLGKSLRNRIKRTLMRFMYNSAALVATGSHQNIELIEKVIPLEGKWKFIPFGVDPEKYVEDKKYKKKGRSFIFTVGAIKPRKGQIITVKALNLLRDEFPDLVYKIGGSFQESQYVQGLRKVIAEHGLEDRVELMGRISDEALKELYATCEVFVLAAQTVDGSREGFPAVFYEAHTFGAPVISTYGFGSEYVIKNGYNGFLVPQRGYQELADAIRNILKNPTLRSEMSVNARREAKKHTWDHTASFYLRAYDDIVASH